MPEIRKQDEPGKSSTFGVRVGEQERLMLKARRTRTRVWSGLGLFGIVGWSVAIPTLLGAALGAWMDRRYPGQHRWTLPLLVGGLCVGCAIAWHWVSREQSEVRREHEGEPP